MDLEAAIAFANQNFSSKRTTTFCEPYAGTAAISLQSHGVCSYPPRVGNKNKAAAATLALLGIEKPTTFVWADQDKHIRLLLRSYTDNLLYDTTRKQLEAWVHEEPPALWHKCRESVLCQRQGSVPENLAEWMVAAAWSVTKGCQSLSYAGPGKVTKSGNAPVCVKDTSRMAAKMGRFPTGLVTTHILCDAADAIEQANKLPRTLVYMDPPYSGMGRSYYVANGGHVMSEGLALVNISNHPTWVASSESLSDASFNIGNTAFAKRESRDWLTRMK